MKNVNFYNGILMRECHFSFRKEKINFIVLSSRLFKTQNKNFLEYLFFSIIYA